MIRRFRKINDLVFRGSAPTIKDLIFLKTKLGIRKIVSLDLESGNKINKATKLLGIKHIILPLIIGKKSSVINFMREDIVKLLEKDGPTFVHCLQGRDRCGFAIALYRTQKYHWSAEKAIKEAKSFGFGQGIPTDLENLYVKLIKKSADKSQIDTNDAFDIVENTREYPANFNDNTSDFAGQMSFAPYADVNIKQWPYGNVDSGWPEQFATRETYNLDDRPTNIGKSNYGVGFPQIGQWDQNTQGINGSGYSAISGGFI